MKNQLYHDHILHEDNGHVLTVTSEEAKAMVREAR